MGRCVNSLLYEVSSHYGLSKKNGAHGRIRTYTARIRSPAHFPVLLRARYIGTAGGIRTRDLRFERAMSLATRRRRRVGSQAWIRTTIKRLTAARPTVERPGIIGGPTGNRTQRELLARHLSAPAAGPWCPALDSNQPLRAFNARQSPDLLTGRLERPAGNDPASQPWQGCTLPLSYGRMVESGSNRTPRPKGSRLQRDGGTSLSLLALSKLVAGDGLAPPTFWV
jgi:hypothetical protein